MNKWAWTETMMGAIIFSWWYGEHRYSTWSCALRNSV